MCAAVLKVRQSPDVPEEDLLGRDVGARMTADPYLSIS